MKYYIKKLAFAIVLLLWSSFGRAQIDMEYNLKEFIDNLLKHSEPLQKAKIKIFLNDKEIENPSNHQIRIDDLRMKIKKIPSKRKQDEDQKDEIEIRFTTKNLNVS